MHEYQMDIFECIEVAERGLDGIRTKGITEMAVTTPPRPPEVAYCERMQQVVSGEVQISLECPTCGSRTFECEGEARYAKTGEL